MARIKAKSSKPKFSAEVVELFSQLKKNDGVKMEMLQEAALVKRLQQKHNIKPAIIQKQAKISIPHIYNLMHLASMTPKMKAYVTSGKIKGTDALNILRKSKDEKEFIKMAEKLVETKVDLRTKENKSVKSPAKSKAIPAAMTEPKRGRGRPRKEEGATSPKRGRGRPKKENVTPVKETKTEVVVDQISQKKEKIKGLIMKFLGNRITKSQNNNLNSLVENLIAN